MEQGIVKRIRSLRQQKYIWFVTGEDGIDVFISSRLLENDHLDLQPGMSVEFTTEPDPDFENNGKYRVKELQVEGSIFTAVAESRPTAKTRAPTIELGGVQFSGLRRYEQHRWYISVTAARVDLLIGTTQLTQYGEFCHWVTRTGLLKNMKPFSRAEWALAMKFLHDNQIQDTAVQSRVRHCVGLNL
jgi:cold shock CspA family protein